MENLPLTNMMYLEQHFRVYRRHLACYSWSIKGIFLSFSWHDRWPPYTYFFYWSGQTPTEYCDSRNCDFRLFGVDAKRNWWNSMESKRKKLKKNFLPWRSAGKNYFSLFFPSIWRTMDWICELAEVTKRSEIVDCAWGPRDAKKPVFVRGGARKMWLFVPPRFVSRFRLEILAFGPKISRAFHPWQSMKRLSYRRVTIQDFCFSFAQKFFFGNVDLWPRLVSYPSWWKQFGVVRSFSGHQVEDALAKLAVFPELACYQAPSIGVWW